jgi:serine/threonine-protein kinase
MKGQRRRIEILQKLGRGPRGELARARAEGIDGECAYKTFFPDIWGKKARRQRFIDDSEVLAGLNVPSITKIYDVGERGSETHLLRAMVKGIPLDLIFFHLVDLPPGVILTIALKIGQALREAHRMGVTHGNLRLSNVILEPGGKVKVTDFALPPPPQVMEKTSGPMAELTAYLSPEQLVGGAEVDERTDLFSLGVILYNLVALDRPFWGKDSAEIRNKILSEPPKSIDDAENCDPKVQLLIWKCLHKNVSERYQSVSALEREIKGSAEPAPEPITSRIFEGIAIRCGLEKIFRPVMDASTEEVRPPRARSKTIPFRPPESETTVETEEKPPATPESRPAPPERQTAPPVSETLPEAPPREPPPAPQEPKQQETAPADVEEKEAKAGEERPAAPAHELSRKVKSKTSRTPQQVIERYIRAWNSRAFLVEYSCFDESFIRIPKQEYIDRRMVTYLKLTRKGEVSQKLEKVLRVERRGEDATVMAARSLEFPRHTELYLDYYTLKRIESEWKITDVRSKRATQEEITRVVDHELTFVQGKSTG